MHTHMMLQVPRVLHAGPLQISLFDWNFTGLLSLQQVSFASVVGLFCLFSRSLLPLQQVSFASLVGLIYLFNRSLCLFNRSLLHLFMHDTIFIPYFTASHHHTLLCHIIILYYVTSSYCLFCIYSCMIPYSYHTYINKQATTTSSAPPKTKETY